MREFQAVVLAAGRGSRLPEVASQTPKCLLPVGPYPLLWYPLNLLHQHSIQDAIVVVLDSQKNEIVQALEKTGIMNKVKLDITAIPSDEDFGTADSLRFIHEKIKTDFLVISCDVVTNVSLLPVINKFREHNAAMATLLFPGKFETGVTVPGPKSKEKPERDLIGIHTDSRRLLFLASTSDFEEVMSVNGHLLRKYGKFTIFSRLVDSHIYILKKWVIDLIKEKSGMSTLKGEFLPYLIKKQMSKHISPPDNQKGSVLNAKVSDEVFNFYEVSQHEKQIIEASFFNDSKIKEPYNNDVIRCYAIESPKDTIGVRVNTTACYFAINSKIHSIWSKLFTGDATTSLIAPSATVNSTQTKDIAVFDSAKLSEKTSLTGSVFGAHCQIKPKNIITNSIIMGHATIEEGCKIENCIIGYKAVVGKKCVLKNCLIGPNYQVEEESDIEKVYLTNADGFMEID